MKIVVFGVGGVGGYFGARLSAHQRGDVNVTLVARGNHLRAMKEKGIEVRYHKETFTVNVKATDNAAEIGVVDVILLCVKDYQLTESIPQLKTLVGPHTVIIPLLNGVGCASQLARELGDQHVVSGYCKILASLCDEPGVILAPSKFPPSMHMGALPNTGKTQVENMKKFVEYANTCTDLIATIEADINAGVWDKLMLIASMTGVSAVTRAPISVIIKYPDTFALIRNVMNEIAAIAQAQNINITQENVEKNIKIIEFAASTTPQSTGSMARDMFANKASELHALYGDTLKIAQRFDVPTPCMKFIYSALLPMEAKARGEISFSC